MDDEIEIQDLEAYEIRELLLDQGSEVDEEQAAAIQQFIEDIGGLENALAAVDMLDGIANRTMTTARKINATRHRRFTNRRAASSSM